LGRRRVIGLLPVVGLISCSCAGEESVAPKNTTSESLLPATQGLGPAESSSIEGAATMNSLSSGNDRDSNISAPAAADRFDANPETNETTTTSVVPAPIPPAPTVTAPPQTTTPTEITPIPIARSPIVPTSSTTTTEPSPPAGDFVVLEIPLGTLDRIANGDAVEDVMPSLLLARVGQTFIFRNLDSGAHFYGPVSARPGETVRWELGTSGDFTGYCSAGGSRVVTLRVLP
jgi:hypothetical protein